MPVYEYECPNCKKTLELTQSLSDRTVPDCDSGCNVKMERVLSKSSFHLKGGGWYKDGYSKKS